MILNKHPSLTTAISCEGSACVGTPWKLLHCLCCFNLASLLMELSKHRKSLRVNSQWLKLHLLQVLWNNSKNGILAFLWCIEKITLYIGWNEILRQTQFFKWHNYFKLLKVITCCASVAFHLTHLYCIPTRCCCLGLLSRLRHQTLTRSLWIDATLTAWQWWCNFVALVWSIKHINHSLISMLLLGEVKLVYQRQLNKPYCKCFDYISELVSTIYFLTSTQAEFYYTFSQASVSDFIMQCLKIPEGSIFRTSEPSQRRTWLIKQPVCVSV